MIAKNFVNFHVLISHSPSCLNRDDMNMQKTAIFGGVKRVRVSSQSLKRAMRTGSYYKNEFGPASVRTRELQALIPLFAEQLKDEFDATLVAKTMELFVRVKAAEDDSAIDEGQDTETSPESPTKLAVAPWALNEIRALCAIVKDVVLSDDEIANARDKAAKQKGKKKRSTQEFVDDARTAKRLKTVNEKAPEVRSAMSSAVDIALSGRMATSGLMTSVDGSLAVAHAITTHAVEPQDVDWFTAVDDLVPMGSGHLDTQEFSAGVFYRYASLNLKQLQVNLGLIDKIDSEGSEVTRRKALDIARHVLHMLATVVPTAKRQSFAADNLADFAIVSFSDVPISLANGFEQPIERAGKAGGYLAPSERALSRYWERLNQAYGLDERAAAFCFDDTPWQIDGHSWPKSLKSFDTLKKLEDWAAGDGSSAGDGSR